MQRSWRPYKKFILGRDKKNLSTTHKRVTRPLDPEDIRELAWTKFVTVSCLIEVNFTERCMACWIIMNHS